MEKKLKTTTTKKTNRWWLDSALQNIFCWLLGYGINFEFGTKQLFHSAFFFFFCQEFTIATWNALLFLSLRFILL